MEFRNTLEILNANTEEIRQLFVRLEQRNEISTIELDLILDKLRNIYDIILDLQSAVTRKDKPAQEQITYFPSASVEGNKPYEPKQEERKPVQEQIEPELKNKTENKATNQPFVSDRFKTSRHSLNEELSKKSKGSDIPMGSKSKPPASITSAFGLNEKFEIINELFGGDKSKFEQTMQEVNNAGSFVEAYNYLNSSFNWDMDNSYVQRILELIRRKLIVKRNE